MATEPGSTTDQTEIFQQLEAYPWDKDAEFQGGLSAILGPNPTTKDPAQLTELTLRAQCFYLSRKRNIPIDFEGYKNYLSSNITSNVNSQTNSHPSSDPNILLHSMNPPSPPHKPLHLLHHRTPPISPTHPTIQTPQLRTPPKPLPIPPPSLR